MKSIAGPKPFVNITLEILIVVDRLVEACQICTSISDFLGTFTTYYITINLFLRKMTKE